MKKLIITLLSILPYFLNAGQFQIGDGEEYSSPNAFYQAIEAGTIDLLAGDTINIIGGEYRGDQALAVWRVDDLLIRGIFERANLYADGAYIFGKGIFVSAGDNIRYENIAFYDAAVPDKNGAGIRLDGSGLVVRHCLFYNNENGILANNSEDGEILIEHSEFAVGGFGDGFSHNIYINHTANLTIQFCYFHDAAIGHQVKSRADKTIIQYNRIADIDGNSSRLIDISNGGQCLILGNELIQGPNAENNNLIGYGLEGLSNPGPHKLEIINNTILNYRNGSCVFFHTNPDTDTFLVANNILGGVCSLFKDKEPQLQSNYLEEDISEINFVDEMNLDFDLEAFSFATNNGMELNDEHLQPLFEYVHPLEKIERTSYAKIDIGAHEAQVIISVEELYDKRLVYPNPAVTILNVSKEMQGPYNIFSINGRLIKSGSLNKYKIPVGELEEGIYILRFENLEPIKFLKI